MSLYLWFLTFADCWCTFEELITCRQTWMWLLFRLEVTVTLKQLRSYYHSSKTATEQHLYPSHSVCIWAVRNITSFILFLFWIDNIMIFTIFIEKIEPTLKHSVYVFIKAQLFAANKTQGHITISILIWLHRLKYCTLASFKQGQWKLNSQFNCWRSHTHSEELTLTDITSERLTRPSRQEEQYFGMARLSRPPWGPVTERN